VLGTYSVAELAEKNTRFVNPTKNGWIDLLPKKSSKTIFLSFFDKPVVWNETFLYIGLVSLSEGCKARLRSGSHPAGPIFFIVD
jgi:hypothetical protein